MSTKNQKPYSGVYSLVVHIVVCTLLELQLVVKTVYIVVVEEVEYIVVVYTLVEVEYIVVDSIVVEVDPTLVVVYTVRELLELCTVYSYSCTYVCGYSGVYSGRPFPTVYTV